MKCEICGSEVSDGAKFCGTCGSEITPRTKALESQVCPNCGDKLKAGDVFCGSCGSKLDTGQSRSKNKTDIKSTEKKIDKGLIVLIVVLITVILICAIVLFMTFKREKSVDKYEFNAESVTESAKYEDDTSAAEAETEEGFSNLTETIEYGMPIFTSVTATSELSPEAGNQYHASNVYDGEKNTAWVEGVAGDGIGESISFSADREQKVSGLKILNGYCKSLDVYMKNNRVKKIHITFSDGTEKMAELADNFGEVTDIRLDEPVICSGITISITEVYKGSKYDDTCVSEVEIY